MNSFKGGQGGGLRLWERVLDISQLNVYGQHGIWLYPVVKCWFHLGWKKGNTTDAMLKVYIELQRILQFTNGLFISSMGRKRWKITVTNIYLSMVWWIPAIYSCLIWSSLLNASHGGQIVFRYLHFYWVAVRLNLFSSSILWSLKCKWSHLSE